MKKTIPKCRRCRVNMKPGIALKNGWTGSPDFIGDTGKEIGCTQNLDPRKACLVDVWKCPKCGHSISK